MSSTARSSLGPRSRVGAEGAGGAGEADVLVVLVVLVDDSAMGKARVMMDSRAEDSCGEPAGRRGDGGRDRARERSCVRRDMSGGASTRAVRCGLIDDRIEDDGGQREEDGREKPIYGVMMSQNLKQLTWRERSTTRSPQFVADIPSFDTCQQFDTSIPLTPYQLARLHPASCN